MGWKRLVGSRWTLVSSALFGAPGVLDDFSFWQRSFGDMSAGLQGALIGGGGVMMAVSALILIERNWALIRANAQLLANLARAMLVLGLVGGIGYGLTLVAFSRSETAWVHPTLTPVEQRRVAAECRMRADEAIQGGMSKNPARTRYVANCLLSEGFNQVRDDG